ncbi:APC family permease [Paenarthrobacter sp. Z7-10]|uniref:APC family permease n=1 Tax=Paenarthrobacter sp. Z7-10 TaxID=2787635 RepID=UPI0022A9B214|nr:APC family permease [Paenarthrobacter sp. Z7-10]
MSKDPARVEGAEHELEEFGYAQELKRSMSLTDVVVYGLIYMVPLATLPVFGIIYNFSGGMPALVYLVAAIAMFFSALSYKEMAKKFPIAGSVYSYVRIGLNRFVGFLAGWAILLDYLLLPALLSVFAAAAMVAVVPAIPAWVWIVVFVVLAAAINLRGIGLTAGMNRVFLAIQLIVLLIFVVGALIAVAQGKAAFTLDPIFQSAQFSWAIVFGAIPIAALSFIGFDAISTLNEEAKGGGAAVSKATMIVLFAITIIFVVQVYLAAIFVPTGTIFAAGDATNNAFYNIAGDVVGPWFKVVITLTSALVAIFANSIASQATSSRLVFSMARDGQLPRVFSRVSAKRQIPRNAMFLIAGLSLVIGIVGTSEQELLTTLVTFGALTAYILLHVAVSAHFGVKLRSRRLFVHWISPVLGILVLGYALRSANANAKVLGVAWLLIGVGIALYFRFSKKGAMQAESERHDHERAV